MLWLAVQSQNRGVVLKTGEKLSPIKHMNFSPNQQIGLFLFFYFTLNVKFL